jgi:hypothetical protein
MPTLPSLILAFVATPDADQDCAHMVGNVSCLDIPDGAKAIGNAFDVAGTLHRGDKAKTGFDCLYLLFGQVYA